MLRRKYPGLLEFAGDLLIVGVEVAVDHDLATEPPEHPLGPIVAVRHEPRNRTAGSSDHDLLARLSSLEQLRQVGLRVMDVDIVCVMD